MPSAQNAVQASPQLSGSWSQHILDEFDVSQDFSNTL
jgi:hypothetical protein